jgi:hypothetical protein
MNRETPTERFDPFYGAQDFDFDLALSRSFWEGNEQNYVILYRFDGVRSQIDDLYGESLSEEKVFFAPVKLKVVPNIGEVVKSFKVPGGLRTQMQAVTLGFYLAEVMEKECRPRDGDFVRYDNGQGPMFYELGGVDELLGNNTHAGVPFYIGAVGTLVGANAIPQNLLTWDLE